MSFCLLYKKGYDYIDRDVLWYMVLEEGFSKKGFKLLKKHVF